MLLRSLLPLLGGFSIVPALAQQAGTFRVAGQTQVSAMMVRIGTHFLSQRSYSWHPRCLWLAMTRSTSLIKLKGMPTRLTDIRNTHLSGW
jgi:hypothetical protein